jgi:hypothetical protein
VGRTDLCIAHGGGKRCDEEGCDKSVQGKAPFCTMHTERGPKVRATAVCVCVCGGDTRAAWPASLRASPTQPDVGLFVWGVVVLVGQVLFNHADEVAQRLQQPAPLPFNNGYVQVRLAG